MSGADVVIEKDMGITHAEFLRLLPRALGGAEFQVIGTTIIFKDQNERTLTIQLGPESERRIALMRIPRTMVNLKFQGYDAPALEVFLTHFDHSYQRGGG
tara:strand:- start:50347 stop:50646 length:300 start_codon:yes stop_codon:yes gene_type:complete